MASAAMYRLQPILDSAALAVTLPTCMYRLPPIHPAIDLAWQAGGGGDTAAADLAQLERRQETILARLADLRGQVEQAAQRQRSSSGGVFTDASVTMTTDAAPPPKHRGDIVVVASADHPPLSLLLLRRLAPAATTLTSHVHSTCPAVPAAELSRAFSWRGADGAVHLRLIWKPVGEEVQLRVSPSGQGCPLLGEDQVLRYVARALLPLQYEAGHGSRAALVDQLLDQADRLRNGNGKEKQAVLRALNGLLGTQPFLLGAELALVDGVVWSALRAAALQSPPNVSGWSGRVSAAAGLADEPSPAAAPKTSGGTSAPKATAKPSGGCGAKGPPHCASAVAAVGHLDQAGLMTLLSRLNVVSQTVTHPAVFTVEAMMPHLASVSGAITKNLFLRDKKKVLYLLTARHDAEFRLSDVARQLPGAKELRFGDEEVMWARLGVRQGCVTPLALVNDTERAVRLLVDAKMLDGTFEKLWFHPLTNEATTGMSAADFRRFAAETGHEPTLVNI